MVCKTFQIADSTFKFNVTLDETDVLLDDLRPWKRPELSTNPPPPLVIEVYVDTSHLSHNQALVVIDDAGKRWDVADTLASSADSSPRPSKKGGRFCEVVLERWTIELGDAEDYTPSELNDALPNVYKKGVVLFRSLYTLARFLPAWKLYRKLIKQPSHYQALRLKFRIRQGHDFVRKEKDLLYSPLCPSENGDGLVVERHRISPLICPAGPLSIAVDYRTNCELGVADAEALLSSRFLGLDAAIPVHAAGRSLPGGRSERSLLQHSSLSTAAGEQTSRIGAYGSLGTFHAPDKRGSPVTELKQRVLDDDNNEIQREERARMEGIPRRPSISLVSNPPFKAGSLASSPRPSPALSTSTGRSDSSFPKYSSTPTSKRVSLNPLPQQALRAPSVPSEMAIASSGSSSPKPAPVHRYSSSFANRTRRFPSQGGKAGESNASSGRGSSSSKEKSGPSNDGTPGSLASGKSDEDDIAFFISQVENAKDLPSFRPQPSSRDKTVNLAKYSNLRDPNTQLAEEMSSSSLLQTSVTPPSRRLSNVPALSTSSSPSRALAHAPHVRSRLSTQSIAEEITAVAGNTREGSDSPKIGEAEEEEEAEEDDEEPFIFPQDNF